MKKPEFRASVVAASAPPRAKQNEFVYVLEGKWNYTRKDGTPY